MIIVIYYLFLILIRLPGGHFSSEESLSTYFSKLPHIAAEEIAIIQYDSRVLSNYWNISARWNRYYSENWEHSYFYLTQSSTTQCRNGRIALGLPWCKVKAMMVADRVLPTHIRYILYLDSDALITSNFSMNTIRSFITEQISWNWDDKPVAFNQDGPGYACKQAIGLGYPLCLNSGVVLWKRSQMATYILEEWWRSSLKPLNSTKYPMNWKKRWPWEQAQLYEVYLQYSSSIMVLSFPSRKFLPWTSKKNPKLQYPTDSIEPWCFTHWPLANCFITHFCASIQQKQRMRREYDRITDTRPIIPHVIDESSKMILTRELPQDQGPSSQSHRNR